jgi:hypothetical protein
MLAGEMVARKRSTICEDVLLSESLWETIRFLLLLLLLLLLRRLRCVAVVVLGDATGVLVAGGEGIMGGEVGGRA